MGRRKEPPRSPSFGEIYVALSLQIDANDQSAWMMNYRAASSESLPWSKWPWAAASGQHSPPLPLGLLMGRSGWPLNLGVC